MPGPPRKLIPWPQWWGATRAGEDPKARKGTPSRGSTRTLPHPGGSMSCCLSQLPPRPSHSFPFASAEEPVAALGKTRPKARAALSVLGPAAPCPQSGAEGELRQGCLTPETPPGGWRWRGLQSCLSGCGIICPSCWSGSEPTLTAPCNDGLEARSKGHKTLYRRDPQMAPQPPRCSPGCGGSRTGRAGSPMAPPGKHGLMEPEQGWPV